MLSKLTKAELIEHVKDLQQELQQHKNFMAFVLHVCQDKIPYDLREEMEKWT